MDTYKYVVLGGGLAGERTCDGIRRVDTAGSVALVAGEAHPPYQRPPLSKGSLTGRKGLARVSLQESSYYDDHGIDLITGVRAIAVSPDVHQVELADGRALGYQRLCLATGGVARRLPIPGTDLSGVYTLRTIGDADRIREAAGACESALVVGGSFIGSEAAASLAQLGLPVTMVFPETRLLERLAPEPLGLTLRAMFEARSVQVRPGTRPVRFEGAETVQRALLDDGSALDADLVVLGVGIDLGTGLAVDAGLEIGDRGAVIVDEFLCTSAPDIYAAGDIVSWPDPTFGTRLRVEHWDVARRQGLRAGRNMAGEEKPYTSLPYFFSDLFDLSFEVWGNLAAWDQTVLRGTLVRGTLEGGSFGYYYFDSGRMVGVLAAGRPDDERKPMQALVRARPRYDRIAERLRDESVDLTTL